MTAEFLIWRPILAGKVTLGEVRRREIGLADLITLNQLLDAQAAAEHAQMERNT